MVDYLTSMGITEPAFTAPVTQDFSVKPADETEPSLLDTTDVGSSSLMKPGFCREKCAEEKREQQGSVATQASRLEMSEGVMISVIAIVRMSAQKKLT